MLFSLLYRQVEKKDKDLMDDREEEVLKLRRVDGIWSNWLAGFLIYRVTAKANPWRAATFIQYMDVIYKAYSYFPGLGWLQYDEEFWMKAVDGQWDQTESRYRLCQEFVFPDLNACTVVILCKGCPCLLLPALQSGNQFNPGYYAGILTPMESAVIKCHPARMFLV